MDDKSLLRTNSLELSEFKIVSILVFKKQIRKTKETKKRKKETAPTAEILNTDFLFLNESINMYTAKTENKKENDKTVYFIKKENDSVIREKTIPLYPYRINK